MYRAEGLQYGVRLLSLQSNLIRWITAAVRQVHTVQEAGASTGRVAARRKALVWRVQSVSPRDAGVPSKDHT